MEVITSRRTAFVSRARRRTGLKISKQGMETRTNENWIAITTPNDNTDGEIPKISDRVSEPNGEE
jgi:hypothetical protein